MKAGQVSFDPFPAVQLPGFQSFEPVHEQENKEKRSVHPACTLEENRSLMDKQKFIIRMNVTKD
ncbi:hypothetical protein IM774_02560 [Erysipelotrichaceae bacterium RD49]|nr:hypothetical protein [Erysipelotrichaceae bacterium RD49]